MSGKILIVDDEPHILRLLASRLKANRYEVIAASDATQGFRAANEERPDLILLDIRMPGKDGLSLFNSLKESNVTSGIPIVFITAYPQKNVRESVLALGAVDFVAKPFNAEDLLRKVEKALTAPRPAKNIEMQKQQKSTLPPRKTAGEFPRVNGVLNKLDAKTGKPIQGLAKTDQAADEEIEYLE
jgi:DNA-binding response OmpR family regulator